MMTVTLARPLRTLSLVLIAIRANSFDRKSDGTRFKQRIINVTESLDFVVRCFFFLSGKTFKDQP